MKIKFNKNLKKIIVSGTLALTTTILGSSCSTNTKEKEMLNDESYRALLDMQTMLISYSSNLDKCDLNSNHSHKCFYPEFDENGNLQIKYATLNHDEINNAYGKIYNSGIVYEQTKVKTSIYNKENETIKNETQSKYVEGTYGKDGITQDKLDKLDYDKNNNLMYTQVHLNDNDAISINGENKKVYSLSVLKK